jgi:hypothetical protein
MKTLKLMIATVFVSLTLNGFAGTGGEGTTEKEIQKHLSFPNILLPVNKSHSNKVDVVFTTNESGKVNLVIAKTENESLKKEIEKNFSKLVLKTTKPNVCYGVTLKLKTY